MNTPSKQALRAAHAIINSVANPALKYETRNCNASALARIIDEEFKELREALADCIKAMDRKVVGMWRVRALERARTALASEHPVDEW